MPYRRVKIYQETSSPECKGRQYCKYCQYSFWICCKFYCCLYYKSKSTLHTKRMQNIRLYWENERINFISVFYPKIHICPKSHVPLFRITENVNNIYFSIAKRRNFHKRGLSYALSRNTATCQRSCLCVWIRFTISTMHNHITVTYNVQPLSTLKRIGKYTYSKSKGKFSPIHAMQAKRGSGGAASFILNLGTWKCWEVDLTARQFTSAEETPIPTEYEAVWFWIQYGCHVEDMSLSNNTDNQLDATITFY
jgi:hypothetical protein